jgi:hypothetical protein
MSAVTGYYAVVLINVQYCLFGSNRKSITPFLCHAHRLSSFEGETDE